MDFLRESSRLTDNAGISPQSQSTRSFHVPGLGPRQEHEAAMKRAALMLADRKRRLMDNREDYARRRSVSSLPFGPTMATQQNGQTHGYRPRPSLAIPQRSGGSTDPSVIEPPIPRRTLGQDSQNRQGREITLPRWQPDSEVTSCPICGTSFNFWFRKHHCRKCGRVVCANCSPHRITIPRQFIVQPPQDTNRTLSTEIAAGIEVVDLTEDQDTDTLDSQQGPRSLDTPQSPVLQIDPALGGGQEVRLCNPCVPDPNPLPHLPFEPPTRFSIHSFPRPAIDRSRIPSNESHHPSLSIPQRSSSTRQSFQQFERSSSHISNGSPSQGRRTSSSSQQSSTQPGRLREFHRTRVGHPTAYGSVPDRSTHDRYLDSIIPPLHLRHRHHASVSTVPDSRYRSLSDLNAPLPPRPPLSHPRPQPQLREEDECPICHHALPPKGPDGNESTRERHVAECIEQHFSSSTPRSARPHPSAATNAAVMASAATPHQSHSQESGRRPSEDTGDGNSSENAFRRMGSQRRRVAGMVTYSATEKDCVGEGGEPAECVICFEDFEQGAEMGRLECLCKFHKICIRQWWDTKGVGACPVHQGGLT